MSGPRTLAARVKAADSRELRLALLCALLHVPLGVSLFGSGSLGMAHPIAALAVGMYLAVRREYSLGWVAVAAGYIVGSEILWRMTSVGIFWEFGKYGMAAIMITALIVRRELELPMLPFVYGALLIPACVLTLFVLSPSDARGVLSADMSGPFALVVACWFFSRTRLNVVELRRLIFAVLIPLLSVAFVTLFFTVTAEEIQFTTESNFATSGGFGPNQVSSMLGFGAFLAIACLVLFRNGIVAKLVFGALILFFSAQSVMTFSRGGIYNAVGAAAFLLLFHFRSLKDGLQRMVPLVVVSAAFVFLILPQLNNFTGGKLEERFAETNTTNRLDIIKSDLEIFEENPVFGVGVGVSRSYRERFLSYAATSHTEFARLISDHGSFGLAALLILLTMAVVNFGKNPTVLHRALVAGLSAWCLLYMLNAGMRLAAPSFLWGLTFVNIIRSRPLRFRVRRNRAQRRIDSEVLPAVGSAEAVS